MSERNKQPLQIPLMYAFREAFRARDAKTPGTEYRDGMRVLSDRGRARRRGITEEELRVDLDLDISKLANTINLEATVDLEGCDYVKRSVLNYGVADLSNISDQDRRRHDLPDRLRASLINHEPRFIPETVHIAADDKVDHVEQRFRFNIDAEVACRPHVIPADYVAEIDVGSGRLRISDAGGSAE